MIVIGIDAHKRTHTLVAVDDVGVKLGEKTVVEATGRGHASALRDEGAQEIQCGGAVGCGGQSWGHWAAGA